VTSIGARRFTYLATVTGLGTGTGGTYTDAAVAAGAAQTITSAVQTGPGIVTITSTLPAFVGDRVTITGVTPTGYNGTFTVTGVPSAGTFTYTDPNNQLAPATNLSRAFVTDANPALATAVLWHDVTITNNIIVNNMAGWDGAGISLQDALNVNIVNNTIMHNDTLATSGVLTNSIGTPQASAPAGNCYMAGPTGANTASCPQSAGVTSIPNSSLLTTTFVVPITCPPGHYTGATALNGTCTHVSYPVLYSNILWQNRSFHVGITAQGTGQLNQQNVIRLFDAVSNAAAPTQTATGQCSTGVTYWDLGVRGDRSPTTHESGFTLSAIWSVTTYGGQGNINADPVVIGQYCNGSRVPPECTLADGCGGLHGFGVPPGIPDSIAGAPLFSLVPSATVDEGNNWINVSWGPLSLTNPSLTGGLYGNYGGGLPLGNYSLGPLSPSGNNGPVSHIPCPGNVVPCRPPGFALGITTPTTDFFGNRRPNGNGAFDIGAVELTNR